MAFISSVVSEKSNIWKTMIICLLLHQLRVKLDFLWLVFCVWQMFSLHALHFGKATWKLCVILSGLKLLGMTMTPLWILKRRATWALLLLYFFPMDTRSSSSSMGGHFKFTLNQSQEKKFDLIVTFYPLEFALDGLLSLSQHTYMDGKLIYWWKLCGLRYNSWRYVLFLAC